jgi:hypothetical protein
LVVCVRERFDDLHYTEEKEGSVGEWEGERVGRGG